MKIFLLVFITFTTAIVLSYELREDFKSQLHVQKDCSKYTEDYIPKDLMDAINALDCLSSEEDKNKFKEIPEDKAVIEQHFGGGIGIRNSWIYNEGASPLGKFFLKNEIYHPDDMSSIIIRSFHRRLNNKEIDLKGQIKKYKAYWAPIKEYEKKKLVEALKAYNEYDIGDTISFYYENHEGWVTIPMREWTFNPNNGFKITGKLISKEILKDSVDVKFEIKILNFNENYKLNASSIGRHKIGEVIEHHLTYSKFDNK